MERMQGKVATEEELKELGWKIVLVVTDVHLVFGKGDKRICWNRSTGVIEKEYTYQP